MPFCQTGNTSALFRTVQADVSCDDSRPIFTLATFYLIIESENSDVLFPITYFAVSA